MRQIPRREDIDQDTPLRLDVAAALAFPAGGVKASSLRVEAARGNLAIERVAGKYFTTLRAISEMRARCRVDTRQAPRGSQRGAVVDAGSLAQAALMAKLQD